MYLYNEFFINILNDINTLSFPSKSNSKQIELTVHTEANSMYLAKKNIKEYAKSLPVWHLYPATEVDGSNPESQSTEEGTKCPSVYKFKSLLVFRFINCLFINLLIHNFIV